MKSDSIIIIPTYNEKENIENIRAFSEISTNIKDNLTN